MKWIHLILILFFFVRAEAIVNLDSLWSVWSNESLQDTVRVDALYEYSRVTSYIDYPDSALVTVKLMLDFSKKSELSIYSARAFSLLGAIQMRKPNWAKAQKYMDSSLLVYRELNHREGIASSVYSLGVAYYNLGQYMQSLNYYLMGLALKEEIGDSSSISGILNNIGLIYKDQEDYTTALLYFKKSVQIGNEIGEPNSVAQSNIGDIYLKQGNYLKALNIYEQLVLSAEESHTTYYHSRMSSLLSAIAEVHVELGDYEMALKKYFESLDHKNRDSTGLGVNSIESDIGAFYVLIGESGAAIKWCVKGLRTARDGNAILVQHKACKCLYEAYKLEGDDTRALKYYELFQRLDDSLKVEETAKAILRLEFKEQVLSDSLRQAEALLISEITHQEELRRKDGVRNVYISAGAILLLLAFALFSRNRYVVRAKNAIEIERKRSDNLLLNILPAEIAEELKERGEAVARNVDSVSVLFTDFKGFTQASATLSATALVHEINICFKEFDGIVDKYNVEKIKTIGDAYMAAGGLPLPDIDSVRNTILAALEMQEFMEKRMTEQRNKGLSAFEMRVGIHTGPVVAGIVGFKKFQYDIWGDTVNVAARMESCGEVCKVNISESTKKRIEHDKEFKLWSRGKIQAKGKGEISMYFIDKV